MIGSERAGLNVPRAASTKPARGLIALGYELADLDRRSSRLTRSQLSAIDKPTPRTHYSWRRFLVGFQARSYAAATDSK